MRKQSEKIDKLLRRLAVTQLELIDAENDSVYIKDRLRDNELLILSIKSTIERVKESLKQEFYHENQS